MRNTNPALAQAYQLDQQGRLLEAIESYRRLLASEPRNSDALHLLGVAMAKMGRPEEALEAIASAARLQPDNPSIHANLGNALSGLGRHDEAVACFDRALALSPDFAVALHARGLAQLRLGQLEAAVLSLDQALRLAPANASMHSDLAVALERLDRKEEARRHLERATFLNPKSVEAQHNLALLQAAQGALQEALASLDRALALQPRHAPIHANRGNVLADLGRTQEAIASYDQALALQPRNVLALTSRGRLLLREKPAQALANFDAVLALEREDFAANFYRGVALTLLERDAEALMSFERALSLNPSSAEVLNNKGVTLSRLNRSAEGLECFRAALASEPENMQALTNGANTLTTLKRFAEAQQWFDRALALKPHDPELGWGKGRLLLSLGQFKQGWPLYEQRLHLTHLRPLQRHLDLPRWVADEPITGKTLLVHAEQGLGDTLQFCRYIPLLEARGAKVIFEVQPALQKLLRTLAMQGEILAFDEPLPPFDLSTPLLSLPLLLGTELASIPAAVPYLRSDKARVAAWRARLGELPGLKVGIAWQGNVETEKQGGFAGRSFELTAAAPLAHLSGVTLVSLQKGPGSEQRAQVDFGDQVLQLTDPWEVGAEEVLDTAALMTALDLIVTSDTATAHLAGALGLPVWVVLAASADWRWLTDRDDSPWYPTMRLFRQTDAGVWPEVFERVARELAARARERELP
jgi:tetratricopeptide (TPR) repeat protein